MTAKTAASAIAALISIAHLGGCNTSATHAHDTGPSLGAFESRAIPLTGPMFVAGDALGVELHLAACEPMFTMAQR